MQMQMQMRMHTPANTDSSNLSLDPSIRPRERLLPYYNVVLQYVCVARSGLRSTTQRDQRSPRPRGTRAPGDHCKYHGTMVPQARTGVSAHAPCQTRLKEPGTWGTPRFIRLSLEQAIPISSTFLLGSVLFRLDVPFQTALPYRGTA